MKQIAAGKTVSFINDISDWRAVSIVNRPLAGTNYWVDINGDITERRLVERKCAARRARSQARADRGRHRLVPPQC